MTCCPVQDMWAELQVLFFEAFADVYSKFLKNSEFAYVGKSQFPGVGENIKRRQL